MASPGQKEATSERREGFRGLTYSWRCGEASKQAGLAFVGSDPTLEAAVGLPSLLFRVSRRRQHIVERGASCMQIAPASARTVETSAWASGVRCCSRVV